MRFSITDLDTEQLHRCMAALGVVAAGAAAVGATASPTPPPMPPAGPAAPPPPPPPAAAPVMDDKEAQCLAAMKAYGAKYGIPALEPVFAQLGPGTAPTIKGKTPEQLDWLIAAFSR